MQGMLSLIRMSEDKFLLVIERARQVALERLAKSDTRGRPKLGNRALSELLAQAGTVITPSAIRQWRRVPQEHVEILATITGIPRYELRPDVYGHEAPTPAAAVA